MKCFGAKKNKVRAEFLEASNPVRIKEIVLPLIAQLEQEVVNAHMRADQLQNECPPDWSPIKNELDDLLVTIGISVNRAWRDLSLATLAVSEYLEKRLLPRLFCDAFC